LLVSFVRSLPRGRLFFGGFINAGGIYEAEQHRRDYEQRLRRVVSNRDRERWFANHFIKDTMICFVVAFGGKVRLGFLLLLWLAGSQLWATEGCKTLVDSVRSDPNFRMLIAVYDCGEIRHVYPSANEFEGSEACAVEHFRRDTNEAVVRIVDFVNGFDVMGTLTMGGSYASVTKNKIFYRARYGIRLPDLLEIDIYELLFPMKKKVLWHYDLGCQHLSVEDFL